MTKKTAPSPRSFSVATTVALLAILLVCGFLAFITIYSMSTQRRPQTKAEQALLGTWVDEWGNLLNFRSDGTARGLRSEGGTSYDFLEWKCDSREFQYTMYSEPYGVGRYVRRLTLDATPTETFKVIDITETEFRIESVGGETLVLTRTQDAAIEAAP